MRNLRQDEKLLIACLLKDTQLSHINLDILQVVELNDGVMGSIYFVHPEKQKNERRMGKCISERRFSDSDDMPIFVYLDVDEFGDLFELDIYKVDFSPVKKFPECNN